MARIRFMGFETAVAALFLIPIFLLLNRRYIRNNGRTLCYCIFALYLSAVYALVGLPNIHYIRFSPNCNFEPFKYMFSDFTNSYLNVLLFVPLGIFLPLFWDAFKKPNKTLLFGFCVSFLIELLQLFTYRATDINDLITNSFGTFLGWCAGKLLLHFFPRIVPEGSTAHLWTICAVSFGVMFFLQPFPAELLWTVFC